MSGPVLVTGATGKTGRRLVALLREAAQPVRAASRHGETVFDWARPETWEGALAGAASAYLVAPPGRDDAGDLLVAFLETARRLGVRRFVLLSMASLPPGGPAQGQAHQWLLEHGHDWAVLCPGAFMQNFSEGPYLASIRSEDAIYSNTEGGRTPFIDAMDIARAAFATLTATAPLNRAFTLTGDEALSYDEVAERIGRACGRPIRHVRISTPEMAERLRQRGLPERTAALLAMGYETIGAGAQARVWTDLKALTGRPPIRFDAFARANADAWTPTSG